MPISLRRAGQDKNLAREFAIENYQYPENLGSPGLNHYVIFFINVPSNSKVIGATEASYKPQTTARTTQYVSGVLSSEGNATEVAGITISAPMKQLKSAIALYMPNNWSESYAANYEKASYNNLVNIMAESAAKNGGQFLGTAADAFSGALKRLGQETVRSVADFVAGEGFSAGLTKKISNPNTEQIFNGMEHRTFQFEWTLSPKSKTEMYNVERIIEMFRYHMHPELSDGRYLVFPAEFEIEFYSDNDVNQSIGSISTCALTNMSVNYTPNGIWSAFKDTYGRPTSVILTLQFTEMEPLTKDRLSQWGEGPYGRIHDTSISTAQPKPGDNPKQETIETGSPNTKPNNPTTNPLATYNGGQ